MRRMFKTAGVLCLAIALSGCGAADPPSPGRLTALETIDRTLGKGASATLGRTVSVHYTGWLYDRNAANRHGMKIDSSRDRDMPLNFRLGAGHVIRGWDEGVIGMRVGGKRVLMIPPEYAYGQTGSGRTIPPDGSLVFEIELLAVRNY